MMSIQKKNTLNFICIVWGDYYRASSSGFYGFSTSLRGQKPAIELTLRWSWKTVFWNTSWNLKRAFHLNSPMSNAFVDGQSQNVIRRWRQLLDVFIERLHQQFSKQKRNSFLLAQDFNVILMSYQFRVVSFCWSAFKADMKRLK